VTDGPARTPPIAPGQAIDGFVVEAHLHRGGMAELWRVRREGDVPGAPPLVMKVPRAERGEDPASVVGFEVEQMIMPILAGPHVPRFVAKGGFTGRMPYIVMELIPGASLKARFDVAPLPLDEVVEVGWKVATALHDLHRQKLVHLDVKPSNVLFRSLPDGSRGDAVLIDFGLSRHAGLPDLLDEEFTLPMGTGPYMSPEQIRFVRSDPRSDLFALGVMLYHLATGQRPFGAPTSVSGLKRRLWQPPVPPRALRVDLPAWLQEVILRCLEVDPALRHGTAAQLAFDLRHSDQVALTERAARTDTGGRKASLRRWFASLGATTTAAPAEAAQPAMRSPIVLAAVDVAGAERPLLEAVRDVAHRLMQTAPDARLACLCVIRTGLIGPAEAAVSEGGSLHMELLVQLEHWAHPVVKSLGLRASDHAQRVTFHVIEAGDVAGGIVDYARRNHVDHIVIGARSSGRLRRHLGSVSAQVAAEADCAVTVVRVPGGERG
jgi:nucleotide-binding universal stress UspA family protein